MVYAEQTKIVVFLEFLRIQINELKINVVITVQINEWMIKYDNFRFIYLSSINPGCWWAYNRRILNSTYNNLCIVSIVRITGIFCNYDDTPWCNNKLWFQPGIYNIRC